MEWILNDFAPWYETLVCADVLSGIQTPSLFIVSYVIELSHAMFYLTNSLWDVVSFVAACSQGCCELMGVA